MMEEGVQLRRRARGASLSAVAMLERGEGGVFWLFVDYQKVPFGLDWGGLFVGGWEGRRSVECRVSGSVCHNGRGLDRSAPSVVAAHAQLADLTGRERLQANVHRDGQAEAGRQTDTGAAVRCACSGCAVADEEQVPVLRLPWKAQRPPSSRVITTTATAVPDERIGQVDEGARTSFSPCFLPRGCRHCRLSKTWMPHFTVVCRACQHRSL